MIDTHTHIYLEEFDEDRIEVVRRAREAGVERVILPNVDFYTVQAMHATNDLFPGYCRMAMGLHPTSVEADYRERLEQVRELLFSGEYCAVGEIGLDLYWDKTYAEEQKEAFVVQTGWAAESGLPVIIHCREAFDEISALLQSGRVPAFRGVFHSFTGSAEQVRLLRGTGDYYFGINGIVTFKKRSSRRYGTRSRHRAYIARNRCPVFGSRALSRQTERTFVFALYGEANSRNSGYYDCRGGGGYHGQCCAIVRRRVIPG